MALLIGMPKGEREREIWFVRDNLKTLAIVKMSTSIGTFIWPCTILVQSYDNQQQQKHNREETQWPKGRLAAFTDGFRRNQAHPSKAQRPESLSLTYQYKIPRTELISARWSRPLSNIDEKWLFQRWGLRYVKKYVRARARFKGELFELAII